MRIRTLSKTETEYESSRPEDEVRGVRGFKSHLPHHTVPSSQSVKDFFVFRYPPGGGREKDNRKRKLAEKKDKRSVALGILGYRYESGILISVAAVRQAASWRKKSGPGVRLII